MNGYDPEDDYQKLGAFKRPPGVEPEAAKPPPEIVEREMVRLKAAIAGEREPIPMILFCPACGTQHIDAPDEPKPDLVDPSGVWTNPPHRSHLCADCGHVWRPADVPTTGVAEITTRGEADTSPAFRTWDGR